MRNLNEIECFVKAVELKSLTAAGKALKLPKSNIRRKIKNLEERELHDLPEDEKRKDFELALSLATNHPELFESRMSMSLAIFKEPFSTSLVRERPGLSY